MKRILIVFLVLMFVALINADLGTFERNTCVKIKTISNSSYVNISSISYPNSSIDFINLDMTKNGYTFNYTFCNTSQIGTYIYDYNDNQGNTYVNSFKITNTGSDLSLVQGIIYIVIFFFMVFLLIMSVFGMFAIKGNNTRNEDGKVIHVNNLKYIKFILVFVTYSLITYVVYLIYEFSINFIPEIEGISFLFGWLFNAMISCILLFFFLVLFFIILNRIQDKKYMKALARGFSLR